MSKTATKLKGAELLREAVNHILDHPETWKQDTWHCGTSHCVFGWCQIKAGEPIDEDNCFTQVKQLLGLSEADATWLSYSDRSMPEIHAFTKLFLEGKSGYNRAGYNRAGYNRAGYNRAGKKLPRL